MVNTSYSSAIRRSFREGYHTRVKTSCDFVVVGQGLAGTALAWALRWAGARVRVVDRGDSVTASRVAAGLVTPITGRRLARSWRFDELWPAAVDFYRRVEAETGVAFFHPGPMVRVLRDDEEAAVFAKRAEAEFRGRWRAPTPPLNPAWFADGRGAFEMPTAGRLAVADFLDASRKRFEDEGIRHTCDLDPAADIAVSADGVALRRLGLLSEKVIFCQGIAAVRNPWFSDVSFHPTRGDILTLRIPGVMEERVVHRGVWLLPLGGGLFRAGATYDHANLEPIPSAAGREEIESRLRELLRVPFEVVDHQAAVRPTIDERRPLLGLHPREPRIGFFNGLGSKGSLVAPFFAVQFAKHLTGEGSLDPEVDLANHGTGTLAASPLRLTDQAQQVVREVLRPGDVVIDGTAGNGYDTLLLARLVGPTGHVFAFDVQAAAIARTASLLRGKGIANATLFQRNHADLADVIPLEHRGRIGAAMFHLGYLPGGDRSIATGAGSSVVAVQTALEWLRPGGLLTVTAYSGLAAGAEETSVIREWLGGLPASRFTTREYRVNRGRAFAPVLFVVRKTVE